MLVAAHCLHHLGAVHAGHVQIEQDEIGRRHGGVRTLLPQEAHALFAVGHVMEVDGEPRALEAEPRELDVIVAVLDQQDLRGAAVNQYVVHE